MINQPSGGEHRASLDNERDFRARAKGARLFGAWVAERMGLAPEEADAYARAMVMTDFEEVGDDDVIRKAVADSGLPEAELRRALMRCLAEGDHQTPQNQP